MNWKHLKLLSRLPYDIKYTLIEMFYGHTHFQGVPWEEDFVKFGIKTLKKGLYIPDNS